MESVKRETREILKLKSICVTLCVRVLQPIFLRQLLRYYNSWEVNEFEAYMYALGIILCSAINVFVIHPYMMAILHMGMKIRVACCSLIYRKSLRLTRTALGETTIGQAVNLLSNDVNRFDISIIFLHYLWIGPLETIIITFFMYYIFDIGLSAIIGVASLLLFIPLQGETIAQKFFVSEISLFLYTYMAYGTYRTYMYKDNPALRVPIVRKYQN